MSMWPRIRRSNYPTLAEMRVPRPVALIRRSCLQATQSALITVCIGNGQLRAARDVYEETLRQGIAPHLHAYNCLINAYAAHFRIGDVVRLLPLLRPERIQGQQLRC